MVPHFGDLTEYTEEALLGERLRKLLLQQCFVKTDIQPQNLGFLLVPGQNALTNAV